MMNISGIVRRAFTTSSNSAPPESIKMIDSLTDTSRDSVEASNISTPVLLDSNVVSTAPSEPEGPKDVEISGEIIAKTIEDAILASPSAIEMTPSGKSTSEPRSPSSEPRRSGRERKVVATYNTSILSGNAVHTRRAFRTHQEYNLAQVSRNLAAITMVNHSGEWIDIDGTPITESMVTPAKSSRAVLVTTEITPKSNPRKSGRLEQRGRISFVPVTRVIKKSKSKASEPVRSLRPRKRPASEEPPSEPAPAKKVRAASEEPVEAIKIKKPPTPEKKRTKQWIAFGLYAGQTRTDARRKSNNGPTGPERKYLPMPMFTGNLLMERGRTFVLPYEILNPLAKNEAPAWTNLRKNRFVGDALPTWKKKDHSTQSTCNCTMETKCDSNCLNRSMRYECNEDNCRVGPDTCQNRSFQELKWRSRNKNLSRDPEKNEANLWGVGIEVFRTGNRGNGVRAMRSFEPNQAICEYTGEIITQDEADRRMNEEYKGKTDYYLMTFHEGLIIDATKGSICRFVNHSCDPNCHVEKWVVNGEPRMALFANEDGIKVGEELTYDYNFAPYSQKNLQVCLCGGESCRGVLGPRNLAEQKTQKMVSTTKTITKKKSFQNSRTPSLSPKKKPTKGSPSKPNSARRQTAPAVLQISKAALLTQKKSRAERAQNRSTGKRTGRRMKRNPVSTTIVRQKSVKSITSVSARGKQIRRTFTKTAVKTKTKASGPKKVVKRKKDREDPFRFPESPPPASPLPSPLRSGRQAKPSPKAIENSFVNKSGKIKKIASPGLLRTSLSTKVSTKQKMVSPSSATSSPTSRISNRVIIPSPKVRENADTTSALKKSSSMSNIRLISGVNGKKHRVNLEDLVL